MPYLHNEYYKTKKKPLRLYTIWMNVTDEAQEAKHETIVRFHLSAPWLYGDISQSSDHLLEGRNWQTQCTKEPSGCWDALCIIWVVNTTDINVKIHQAVHLRMAGFPVHIYTTKKFKTQTVTKPYRCSLFYHLSSNLSSLKHFYTLKLLIRV